MGMDCKAATKEYTSIDKLDWYLTKSNNGRRKGVVLIGSEQSSFKRAIILVKWFIQVTMGRNGDEDKHTKYLETLLAGLLPEV